MEVLNVGSRRYTQTHGDMFRRFVSQVSPGNPKTGKVTSDKTVRTLHLKDMATYFLFGLFIRTFEVIVMSVVKFLVTRLACEVLKDK